MDHPYTGVTCIEAESDARASIHNAEESFESYASLPVLAAGGRAHAVAVLPFLTEPHRHNFRVRCMETRQNQKECSLCTTCSSNYPATSANQGCKFQLTTVIETNVPEVVELQVVPASASDELPCSVPLLPFSGASPKSISVPLSPASPPVWS